MVEIYVLPKVKFKHLLDNNNITDENVDEFTSCAFISINDTTGEFYSDPLFYGSHHNVISLFFDDLEENVEIYKAISEEQAKRIVTFLNDNKNVKKLFVHCAAGISRSGAVGQFALDYLRGDKDHFKQTNPHICPNSRVTRLLKKYANIEN